jgi:hypothetical protein
MSEDNIDAGASAGAGNVDSSASEAGASAAVGSAADSWRTGLAPEFQSDPIFKNFNNQDDALRAYKHLRTTQGLPPERIARKPADDAAPEEWSKYHEFNGRPKDEKGYKEPAIDGFKFDDKATEALRKDALSAGLNQKQYETVAAALAKNEISAKERATADYNARVTATNEKIQAEWGEATIDMQNGIKNVLDGIGGEGLRAELEESGILANEKLVRFLGKVAQKYMESTAVGGTGGGSPEGRAMTSSDARAEIAELHATPDFMAKYRKGDGDAMAKMAKLHKYAYPEAKK